MLQTTDCPLCQSVEHEIYFQDFGYDKKSYDIVSCNSCSFKFVNPQPTEAYLSEIYSRYYGDENADDKTEEHLKFRENVFKDLCQRLSSIRIPNKKLLDVGCGNGDFILMAQNHSWQVSGVEISPQAVRFAQGKRNLDVQQNSLLSFPYPNNTFDAVTILDVLEHLQNPQKTLQEINRVLKPQGTLMIRVPNTPFQVLKAKIKNLLKKKPQTTMATPLHLNHFDAESLKNLVAKSGFEIKDIYPGAADGVGVNLLIKKLYVMVSKIVSQLSNLQIGNILCLEAIKKKSTLQ